jgi:hypothetical protein
VSPVRAGKLRRAWASARFGRGVRARLSRAAGWAPCWDKYAERAPLRDLLVAAVSVQSVRLAARGLRRLAQLLGGDR